MHGHGCSKLRQECLPPLPLGFRTRPFDPVREFDNSDYGYTSPRFTTYSLNLFQYVGNAMPAPFRCDQSAGIDYETQSSIPRRGIPELPVAHDFFHVIGKVRVENGCVSALLLTLPGNGDGFREQAAGLPCRLDNGDWLVILLNHNLASLADLLQDGVNVARQVRFADMQHCHILDDTSSPLLPLNPGHNSPFFMRARGAAEASPRVYTSSMRPP